MAEDEPRYEIETDSEEQRERLRELLEVYHDRYKGGGPLDHLLCAIVDALDGGLAARNDAALRAAVAWWKDRALEQIAAQRYIIEIIEKRDTELAKMRGALAAAEERAATAERDAECWRQMRAAPRCTDIYRASDGTWRIRRGRDGDWHEVSTLDAALDAAADNEQDALREEEA